LKRPAFMATLMARTSITKYIAPWKFRRELEAERLRALRARDGDDCARCRRPMRFDLPRGHDQGAAVELVAPSAAGDHETVANLRLCHRRCNASGVDHTGEVTERMRRRNEAALFARSRGSESEAA
jgi:5-methylcytosine-specific restriction endonuclease McrA